MVMHRKPRRARWGDRRSQILEMVAAGYDRRTIARVLGCSPNNVSSIMSQARAAGLTDHYFGEQGRSDRPRNGGRRLSPLPKRIKHKVAVGLEHKHAEALYASAVARNIPLATFVADLLATVVDDNMIDAVMDDGR